MLPDILKIAEEYHLEIDERTRNQKEVLCKCVFCHSSSGKYHLSLNPEKKIFKCWKCKQSGGVLQFEALLSGKPFNEVREKYFGKRNCKSKHPAYELSPEQLKQIGWHSKKRDSFHSFVKKKEEVLRDWKAYQYEELVKYYAIFLLIANYPFKELQKKKYQWYLEEIKKSKVENIDKLIVSAYQEKQDTVWTRKGKKIARLAYKTCLETGDEKFINLFPNVLFAIELMKYQKATN